MAHTPPPCVRRAFLYTPKREPLPCAPMRGSRTTHRPQSKRCPAPPCAPMHSYALMAHPPLPCVTFAPTHPQIPTPPMRPHAFLRSDGPPTHRSHPSTVKKNDTTRVPGCSEGPSACTSWRLPRSERYNASTVAVLQSALVASPLCVGRRAAHGSDRPGHPARNSSAGNNVLTPRSPQESCSGPTSGAVMELAASQ